MRFVLLVLIFALLVSAHRKFRAAPTPSTSTTPTNAPTSGPPNSPSPSPSSQGPSSAPTSSPTTGTPPSSNPTTQPTPSPSPPPGPGPSGQGADFSTPVSTGAAQCLQSQISFAVSRCWHSYGACDTAAPGSLAAFASAGITGGVYMFPCYTCGNPQQQVQEAVACVKGSTFDTFWLDIEGPGQYWSNDQSQNQEFFQGLIQGCQQAGVNIGIYTSASQWIPIFGGSFSAGSAFPLWYANYDGEQNFNDFSPFGGWTSPSIKQYSDSGSACGLSYDQDWAP